MTITYGTPVATSTTTTTLAVSLASTGVGDLNVIVVSANSTGTGVQPVIATPAGWTQIGDSWKTGSPSHEIAAFRRFYQAGDPSSVTVSWAATGNAAGGAMSFSAGMISTSAPIAAGESVFTAPAGPTTDVTAALTLAGSRYVVSVFGNRSGATWSAAADGNIHDAIQMQGRQSSAASFALCCSGTPTSNGGVRSLLSSASTSVNDVGIFAFTLAPAQGSAVGSMGWAGTAVGHATRHGTATGAITWTGSSSGHTARHGAAAGGTAWTGTATGHASRRGTAGGGVSWTGSAAGHTVRRGNASGPFAWAGAAAGHAPTVATQHGTAAGMLTWAGMAAGVTAHVGAVTGTLGWSGAALGHTPGVPARLDATAVLARTHAHEATEPPPAEKYRAASSPRPTYRATPEDP